MCFMSRIAGVQLKFLLQLEMQCLKAGLGEVAAGVHTWELHRTWELSRTADRGTPRQQNPWIPGWFGLENLKS